MDASVLNLLLATSDNGGGSKLTGSFLKLVGLFFVHPSATGSLFVGAGASWGSVAFLGDKTPSSSFTRVYSGSGPQGEGVIGYERSMTSTCRLFVQADATLPFYRFAGASLTAAGMNDGRPERWGPLFVVSIGVGLGPERVSSPRPGR
jgi:hypothetical protein